MDGIYPLRLEDYAPRFAKHYKLRRENGVLEVLQHTDDGPLIWSADAFFMLAPLFHCIEHDDENEVVIWTGAGDTFNGRPGGLARQTLEKVAAADRAGADTMSRHMYEGSTRLLRAVVSLNIPVISAINGPIVVHPETALVSDVVICSENATFYDFHWDLFGVVPGDGVQTVYRELLGHNRARYFLYSGQTISAQEALGLGMVGEVVPRDRLLARAWEIAETMFMSKGRHHRRLARAMLIQPWRELLVREGGFGMAHAVLATSIS